MHVEGEMSMASDMFTPDISEFLTLISEFKTLISQIKTPISEFLD